ncbi:hypothetical protein M430DRAFT_163862 [Amorphotheca resinae ATCC 22711]|uniref:Uncharacterized protein n=1 Tax=Amorphotheca resinae ATCC 22711 TaxID=857342 RepID=A0A2T3BFH5_AMORE|nr:hypothetical protein M430DRAFT_163862 [Amorphotheca resinae ATCC 22711]PSS28166.1 hypothetical protein M430DRAFT_163862 [Amorphotheca resinae ATCC 22711]
MIRRRNGIFKLLEAQLRFLRSPTICQYTLRSNPHFIFTIYPSHHSDKLGMYCSSLSKLTSVAHGLFSSPLSLRPVYPKKSTAPRAFIESQDKVPAPSRNTARPRCITEHGLSPAVTFCFQHGPGL